MIIFKSKFLFSLNKKFIALSILILLGIIQYYYLLGFNFSLYYASGDYIDAANRMFDLDWPVISNNNTANTRTWFYPFLLKIFGSNETDFLQIITVQMLLVCFFPCISFLLLANLGRELGFSFIFSLVLSISCCLIVFSRTLLNENPYSLLTSLFCILFLLLESHKRLVIFITLSIICFLLVATRPTGIVFGVTLIFVLLIYFFHNQISFKRMICLILFIFLGVSLSHSLNKKLNSDFISGSYIFSTMNIIPYLGNKHKNQIEFDPVNIESHKKILQLMSNYEATKSGTNAWKKNAKKVKVSLKKDSCKFEGTKLSSCFLMYANLESYWQVKWVYINKFGLNNANNELKKFALETIINDPISYSKILSKNFFWFLIGTGGGKHISHKRIDKGPFLKNAKQVRFWTRYIKDESQISDHPNTIKVVKKMSGEDYNKELNLINTKVDFKNLKKKLKKFNNYFTVFFNIVWLVGQLSGIILSIMFLANFFIRSLFKEFKDELIAGFCLYITLIGHALLVSYAHPPIGRYLIPLFPICITLVIISIRILIIKYNLVYKLFYNKN